VFTISRKTYSYRCQCKQMHRNYFRITTTLCHLTAIYYSDDDLWSPSVFSSCFSALSLLKALVRWRLLSALGRRVQFLIRSMSTRIIRAQCSLMRWLFFSDRGHSRDAVDHPSSSNKADRVRS